jgi:PTH1 family peptidyl-tRNA hydrolase
MSDISFLCGLGNPGPDFQGTRHNVGFETLDLLARRRGAGWRSGPGPVMESSIAIGAKRVLLIKPLAFMNRAGAVLGRIGEIHPAALLVICDDIYLPLGMVRFREKGGSGGHRGLESVIEQLGTEDFARLRMGVGAPPAGGDWSEYVLEPFQPDELEAARTMIKTAADAVETAVVRGLPAAMQAYNKRVPPGDGA